MDSGTCVIGRGTVADGRGLFLEDGAVLVSGGRIAEIGPWESVRRPELPFYDVEGRFILPGFVNFHHHLYSTFSTGLPSSGPARSFPEILENIWWRLDRVLDDETVYYSALLGALDSLSHGVTVFFDHHASMGSERGSLDLVAEAVARAGSRAVLCFETSDRAGGSAVRRHVEENVSFAAKHRGDPFIGAAFGLHANFTLSEESLSLIRESRPEHLPIHIHCGEAPEDLVFCRERGYRGPVDRLRAFGLLDGSSILAHCVHLDERDYDILEEVRPCIVTNPESNACNRSGRASREKLPDHLLGTDGMTGDIIASLRSYCLLGEGNLEPLARMGRMLFEIPRERMADYLPIDPFLHVGGAADLAVPDYVPLSPVSESNLVAHLVFGAKGGKAFLTAVNGRILWHEGHFTDTDIREVRREARIAAKKLANRYGDWNARA